MWIVWSKWQKFTRWLESLDKQFGMPDIRELIIMFGWSGIGKTEFSFFMAKQNALQWIKTSYISLELPKQDMLERICRARAWVSKYEFQTNKFTPIQGGIMEDAWDEMESIKEIDIISPDDKSLKSIDTIIKQWYDKGQRLFFIDNLDKVTLPSTDNENTRHATITSHLQDLKNDLGICIVLIHHAKKAFNKAQAMQPAGTDGIRGNQKIIDNATQVIEIYRDITDVDDMDFKMNLSQFHQYKDSKWWPLWYQKIQWVRWWYVEYDDPDKKHKKNKEEKPF